MKHDKWKVKKGDMVEVIAGKEKGKRGQVLKVDKKKDRIYIEKVNLIKKHIKRREGQPGRIEETEGGIHVSNVMVVDPKTEKPTRVGIKTLENGQRVRFAKKSGELLDKE